MQENATRPSSFLLAALALLLLTASLAAARTRDGQPASDSAAVVDRFFDAYRSANLEGMLSIYAEDAEFKDVSQRHEVTGRDSLRQQLAPLVTLHKEMDVEIQRQAVTGGLVTVEVIYTGTLDRAALGLEEDLEYSLPAVLLFEVAGGQIQSQTDYLDFRTFTESFGFLQQPASD